MTARLPEKSNERNSPNHPETLDTKSLRQFLVLQAEAVMTRDLITVSPKVTLSEFEKLFEQYDYNGFPVVDDRGLIGIVTQFDFLKAFVFTPDSVVPHYGELMTQSVDRIMTRNPFVVHLSTPLTRVLQAMVETRDKSLPVVDENGHLKGIISRRDILRALNPGLSSS